MCTPLAHCAALLVVVVARAAGESSDATCTAGQACPLDGGALKSPHFWPTARGHAGAYSTTHHVVPTNLSSSFSWKWYHPGGQYHTVSLGCVIDGQRNIYVAGHDGITKLSPDGHFIWNFSRPLLSIPSVPCLSATSLFGSSHYGVVFALDLETGHVLWMNKVADQQAGDTSFVTEHDGLVLAAVDSFQGERNKRVVAMNASDGHVIWSFHPDAPVWNLMALYPKDGTVVFQDLEGRAYRLDLGDGRLLWKAGGNPGTWSDATQMLGPNGVVYAASTFGSVEWCANFVLKSTVCEGVVYAYRLADGKELWRRTFDRPANAFLAVGRVSGVDRPAVVVPIGQQGVYPRPVIEKIFLSLLLYFAAQCSTVFAAAHCLYQRCSPVWSWRRSYCAFLGFLLVMLPGLVCMCVLIRGRTPVLTSALFALDAETGDTRWHYELPPHVAWHTAGDPEGQDTRRALGTRQLCLPNPFSAPTIGADGTVFVGYQDGRMYSVRDSDADGTIDEEREVSTFSTGTAFSTSGAAFAPGMMAITNCDGLFVFKQ